MQIHKILKPSGWVLMSLMVIAMAAYTSKYFLPGMPGAFQSDLYQVYIWEIRIHIAGGIIAALAGLTQFWSGFRNKHKNIHRLLGITYIAAVAISAPAALILSTVSQGGLVTHVGFGMLAVLWAFTTFKALFHITKREIKLHQQWMIRSYALTFAFVLLRVWIGVFMGLGFSFQDTYRTVAWLAWVPNLLIVEYVIINEWSKLTKKGHNT